MVEASEAASTGADQAITEMEHTDSAGARGRIFKYAVYIAACMN